jgi:hypothetical protein
MITRKTIESKDFKNKIFAAFEKGRDKDWAYDGEEEWSYETFIPDDAFKAVCKVLIEECEKQDLEKCCNCDEMVEMVSEGWFCPKCYC